MFSRTESLESSDGVSRGGGCSRCGLRISLRVLALLVFGVPVVGILVFLVVYWLVNADRLSDSDKCSIQNSIQTILAFAIGAVSGYAFKSKTSSSGPQISNSLPLPPPSNEHSSFETPQRTRVQQSIERRRSLSEPPSPRLKRKHQKSREGRTSRRERV